MASGRHGLLTLSVATAGEHKIEFGRMLKDRLLQLLGANAMLTTITSTVLAERLRRQDDEDDWS